MKKVLVVATSRKTRGGITSVIKAYERAEHWNRFHCHWVQTHRDGATWRKLLYFVTGFFDFIVRLPFYDIVHIHTADYVTEKRKRIFAKITRIFRKKLIVHLHSSGSEFSIGGKNKNLYKYSFTHADKILLLSQTWEAIAKKEFPSCAHKMKVVFNPCPDVIPSNLSEREPYILFAGTLNQRKGYQDLIQAFSLISNKFPEWKLKIIGNGDILGGKQLAKSLNLEKRIDFLGWISGDKKDHIFRHASIYCLPSYSEGFPMGVLDAWAYNLPVVTTPVGGIPDVAIDYENMLIFNPGDIEKLSQILSTIISDKKLYTKLSDASKQFSTGKFNISFISSELNKIYESLIHN